MGSVRLYNVTKQFNASSCALKDISLEVLSGELVAVLGSSGCGKTTLLRMIAGLESVTTGQIYINDQDVTHTPTRDRPIGMVFQSYALFPNMTVRQNIGFPLVVRRHRRIIQKRVDELLELLQLTEQCDRYPHQLSGGQQQRTALGRALAASPEILLLDEPLSALDALVRQQLRDEIRRIQQTFQMTTLFVTHDQAEAMAIADRVAIMKDGMIEQLASPLELYDAPKTQFSAAFIGSRNALELFVEQGQICFGRFLSLQVLELPQRRAIAFFRPEDVELTDEHQGHPAIIETKTFQGALTRLQVRISADGLTERIYADLPTRQAIALHPNTTIWVWINPRHVNVFPID
jgi:putative spermidine/putrescine transport system ATP-binding protein